MRKQQKSKSGRGQVLAQEFLRSVPHANTAMDLSARPNGTAMAIVPMRRPRYLVPPLSWILPFSSQRRVELDSVGVSVLEMCDGSHTVEAIMEQFAVDHKLSFRESQLAVGQFVRQLTSRGIIAIVGAGRGGKKQ